MLKKLIKSFLDPIRAINDLLLNNELKRFIVNPKNPLNKFGKRCYSQCDEDGITLEIVRRLNIKKGVFFEFGCDNGTQNNTLILIILLYFFQMNKDTHYYIMPSYVHDLFLFV